MNNGVKQGVLNARSINYRPKVRPIVHFLVMAHCQTLRCHQHISYQPCQAWKSIHHSKLLGLIKECRHRTRCVCIVSVAQISEILPLREVSMWGQVVGGVDSTMRDRWQPVKVLMVFSDIHAASTPSRRRRGLANQPEWISAVQGPSPAQRDNLPAEFVR